MKNVMVVEFDALSEMSQMIMTVLGDKVMSVFESQGENVSRTNVTMSVDNNAYYISCVVKDMLAGLASPPAVQAVGVTQDEYNKLLLEVADLRKIQKLLLTELDRWEAKS